MIWAPSVAFGAGIGAYVLIDDLLASADLGSWGVAVNLLSAIGAYSLVYAAALRIGSGFVYRLVRHKDIIHGEWWQILEIASPRNGLSNPSPLKERYRFGRCRVVQTEDEITVSAESWRLDQSLSSTWRSELATYERGRLLILFLSESSSNDRGPTRGTMHLTVHDRPPQRIIGTFADATPARNSGVLYLLRSKDRWTSIVDQLTAARDETGDVAIDPDEGAIRIAPARSGSR